jgi:hypothetical protein
MSEDDQKFFDALNELHNKYGEAVDSLDGTGRTIKYTADGIEREVIGILLKDGGVVWEFKRSGRTYPLRLSRDGMEAMLQVWHDLTWAEKLP